MGNLEKPLTWILGIAFVGYLFVVNCKCDEENACSLNNGFNIANTVLNNGFNISNAGLNGDVLKVDVLDPATWPLPEGWSVKEVEHPTELPPGFIEYLRTQGFSDWDIELLQTKKEIYDENGEIVSLVEEE